MQNQLLVSSSPHLRDTDTIPKIMWSVAGALVPAGVAAVVLFGPSALVVMLVSVLTAVATEAVIQKLRGLPVTVSDGSAFVTGLLLAYVLPSNVPLYVPIVGSFVAIAIAKQCFGGLGHNIWNPALVGRAFVQLAYASKMTLSLWPAPLRCATPEGTLVAKYDALTQASALSKGAGSIPYDTLDLFLGTVPGCLGETCALALILGGAYLIVKGHVDWRLPACYIGTAAVLAQVLPAKAWVEANAEHLSAAPLYHVLAGGLMLGAFFMATDMVTTPLTKTGMAVFGVGAGALTVLIRFYGCYPEGVCYSILLMNTATPLIDRWCRPRVSGGKKQQAPA